MSFNNTPSLIFLSAIFAFSSCKKSDSVPVAPPAPPVPPAPVMTIASISPASGPSATLDTITGKGFTTLDSVFFNGKGATIVSASDTQLVVKVPPQAGTGKISITAGGKSVTGPAFTFTGNTYLVSTFAGTGKGGFAEGTGTAAVFFTPNGIAIDHDDNLYIADENNNSIRKITPASVVTTFAGSGAMGSADGTGSAASFNKPFGIAIDGNGNLYVADLGNNKIRKITPGGVVGTLAGSGVQVSADGTGAAASFNGPQDVVVDGSGNVFVTEQSRKMRKITPTGEVSTIAGTGVQGSADGPAATASFGGLRGMCFDAAGNLYVTDATNSNIRKIALDGTVTTIAGKAGIIGSADGPALSATFFIPTAIEIDANGFLYVADEFNETIRQISPEGAVTLLAGTVVSSGKDDGPALTAKFNLPSSMAFDSHGNIFVTDAGNSTIRKLTPQ